MNRTIAVRFAGAPDVALLAALGRETFHDAFAGHPLMPPDDLARYLDSAFTVERMTAELNDPRTIFLLAEIDGEAAGYAKLERGATTAGVTAENPIKLKRIYNRQKFIGVGIGKLLMTRCLEEAAAGNHDTIWLTVWQHNLRAQDFYRKLDFVECGTFDFELGATVFADKVFERSVRLNRSVEAI